MPQERAWYLLGFQCVISSYQSSRQQIFPRFWNLYEKKGYHIVEEKHPWNVTEIHVLRRS